MLLPLRYDSRIIDGVSEHEPNLSERVESKLGELAETCIAEIGAAPDSQPPSELTSEPFRQLATDLEYFTQRALRESGDWPPAWWADAFYVDASTVPAERTLVIRGRIMWIDESEDWWTDPVRVTIRLALTLPQIDAYEVSFGDRDKGIRQVSGNQSSALEWADLQQWLVTVRGTGYPRF